MLSPLFSATPLQLADQIQAGFERFRARLPLGRTHLVAMLGNKLARLYAAEQLVLSLIHI